MGRLIAFMHTTLDGYCAGADGGIDWALSDDAEFQAFAADNARGNGVLLMGRKTYDLMAGYWPTPLARQQNPTVAERMNSARKIVVSQTLDQPVWSRTEILRGDLPAQVHNLKQTASADLVTLGSGSIVAQLAAAGLIDEYQLVLNPVALGEGKKLFAGIEHALRLTLIRTRVFGNGCVLLCYAPA